MKTAGFPFVILLYISVIGSAQAQRFEITKSPVIDPKQLMKQLSMSNSDIKSLRSAARSSYGSTLFFNPRAKKTYAGMGISEKGFHFAVLDNYVNFKEIKRLTSESINGDVMLHGFIPLGDRLFVIYSISDAAKDEFTAYVNEVDADMKILGSPVILRKFQNFKKGGSVISIAVSEN
jgi:hypothetical protein